MSPKSKKKREEGLSRYKKKLQKQLRKLKLARCCLNESQDNEMYKIVSIIEKDHLDELKKVMQEAAKGESDKITLLETLWKQDFNDKKHFLRDQQKNSKQ